MRPGMALNINNHMPHAVLVKLTLCCVVHCGHEAMLHNNTARFGSAFWVEACCFWRGLAALKGTRRGGEKEGEKGGGDRQWDAPIVFNKAAQRWRSCVHLCPADS